MPHMRFSPPFISHNAIIYHKLGYVNPFLRYLYK
nr:MAG TPA: hypothetical protein [Caudoviricetes sp.]